MDVSERLKKQVWTQSKKERTRQGSYPNSAFFWDNVFYDYLLKNHQSIIACRKSIKNLITKQNTMFKDYYDDM